MSFDEFIKAFGFKRPKEKEIWNHLQQIIDKLTSEQKELRAHYDNVHDAFVRAAKENDSLRKALKYYSNPKLYEDFVDLSTTAQRALNENSLH